MVNQAAPATAARYERHEHLARLLTSRKPRPSLVSSTRSQRRAPVLGLRAPPIPNSPRQPPVSYAPKTQLPQVRMAEAAAREAEARAKEEEAERARAKREEEAAFYAAKKQEVWGVP